MFTPYAVSNAFNARSESCLAQGGLLQETLLLIIEEARPLVSLPFDQVLVFSFESSVFCLLVLL